MTHVRRTALAAMLTVVSSAAPAIHAQSQRPQLVLHGATADRAAGTLRIQGEKLLWSNDNDVLVTLGGTPIEVLDAAESLVTARLPADLAAGSYRLKVARGTSPLQNATLDLAIPGPRADGACYDTGHRYVDCGNGTVTDTVTGLIWMKDAGCLGGVSYPAASQAAAALASGQCGLTDRSTPGDWRLPTRAEWEATIHAAVVLGCVEANGPSLTDDQGFGCLSAGETSFTGIQFENTFEDRYWSSSAVENNPLTAWIFQLKRGGPMVAHGKDYPFLTWAVRSR